MVRTACFLRFSCIVLLPYYATKYINNYLLFPLLSAKVVVEAINNCTTLEFLNLEGNTLGVDAAKAIATALEKHPEFKRALWKDLFTGRMKTEIPKALVCFANDTNTRVIHVYL